MDGVGEDDALAVEGGDRGVGVAGAGLGVATVVVVNDLDQALQLAVGEVAVIMPLGGDDE